MLLYWGMFTLGFFAGSILAFVTFAPKKPEEDVEYENVTTHPKFSNGPTTFVLVNNGKKEQQLVEKAPELLSRPQAAKES